MTTCIIAAVDPSLLPILAQTKQAASRSGVMQPFVWLAISLLTGLGVLVRLAAPTWLLILVSSLFALIILAALAFAALLMKRGHYYALLSERFNLGAMALGTQTFGNTENGTFQPSPSMMAPLPFEKSQKVIDVAPAHTPIVKEQVDAQR